MFLYRDILPEEMILLRQDIAQYQRHPAGQSYRLLEKDFDKEQFLKLVEAQRLGVRLHAPQGRVKTEDDNAKAIENCNKLLAMKQDVILHRDILEFEIRVLRVLWINGFSDRSAYAPELKMLVAKMEELVTRCESLSARSETTSFAFRPTLSEAVTSLQTPADSESEPESKGC